METRILKRIWVYGIVQGVGFRPTVDRHAHTAGIFGSVSNKGPYVEIFAQGTEAEIQHFLKLLNEEPPERAAILKTEVRTVEKGEGEQAFTDFRIIESEKTRGEIYISPDIAICDTCKAELFDHKNRRYLHPFINCTCCGPRLTILDTLPYDRERTSIKEFPMCPDCAGEYHNPASRRYDAQPVCCNDCGPEFYLIGDTSVRGREAISRARKILSAGGMIAVKGIGGFHLSCDATSDEAVKRLRRLKTRPMKPLAVMMRDLAAVRRECELSESQEKILSGHQKPILLLKKKTGGKLSGLISPDNPTVGVMLPYAPIQLLLFDYDDGICMPDCLVMTSGNVAGAPIARDDRDAVRELSGMCDLILSNNRKIRIRADDSVMDFYRGSPYMIRRSRGYAPLPFFLDGCRKGEVLGMGGELKNTFCIGNGNLFYPSSYIGDLSDLRSVNALEESVGRMETLLETKPQLIACDLHPKYNSSVLAEKLSAESGVPLLRVQHHYAHILSCMAENNHAEKVIGISFDGTGYGTDGTIWGGEILLAGYPGFVRAAAIAPFLQVGGDASSREGFRIAASMIYDLSKNNRETADEQSGGTAESTLAESVIAKSAIAESTSSGQEHIGKEPGGFEEKLGKFAKQQGNSCIKLGITLEKQDNTREILGNDAKEQEGGLETALRQVLQLGLTDEKTARVQFLMNERGINAIRSTSAGRLFDAVSAILGIRTSSTFEGEASMALEFHAEAFREILQNGASQTVKKRWEACLERWNREKGTAEMRDGLLVLPTDRLFAFILAERLKEVVPAGGEKETKEQQQEQQKEQQQQEHADMLAYLFHLALSEMVREICIRIRKETGTGTAALSGGVFQNRLFLELTEDRLKEAGFRVLIHHLIPANDGGIGLGQAVKAMYELNLKNQQSRSA